MAVQLKPIDRPYGHTTHIPEPGPNAGLYLSLTFMAALAVMVGATAIVAVADTWWVLVVAFCVDLAVTAVVLAAIMWIMSDGG
ncbi:MAG: hypothetical protein ACR2HC_01335 [Thermoleophilaceae bacterium]